MSWIVALFALGAAGVLVVTHPKCGHCKSRLTFTFKGEGSRDFSGHPRTFVPFERFCLKCRKKESGFLVEPMRRRQ